MLRSLTCLCFLLFINSAFGQILTLDKINNDYSPTKEITINLEEEIPFIKIIKQSKESLKFEFIKRNENESFFKLMFDKYNRIKTAYSAHSDGLAKYTFKSIKSPTEIESIKECRNIIPQISLLKLTNDDLENILDECDQIYVYFKKRKKEYKVLVERIKR